MKRVGIFMETVAMKEFYGLKICFMTSFIQNWKLPLQIRVEAKVSHLGMLIHWGVWAEVKMMKGFAFKILTPKDITGVACCTTFPTTRNQHGISRFMERQSSFSAKCRDAQVLNMIGVHPAVVQENIERLERCCYCQGCPIFYNINMHA